MVAEIVREMINAVMIRATKGIGISIVNVITIQGEMMSTTLVFSNSSGPRDRNGFSVNEASVRPVMRPRTGPRGTDAELAKLLDDALDNLERCDCSFWACDGPTRPQHMVTCTKCWAMRMVATVLASLQARAT